MLHIECCINIDAGIEKFFDVLPALGMPATLCVGVRQFINYNLTVRSILPRVREIVAEYFFCRHGNTNTHNENRTGR
jgi:hypothetical protein